MLSIPPLKNMSVLQPPYQIRFGRRLSDLIEDARKITFALNDLHTLVCLCRNCKADVLADGERRTM